MDSLVIIIEDEGVPIGVMGMMGGEVEWDGLEVQREGAQ